MPDESKSFYTLCTHPCLLFIVDFNWKNGQGENIRLNKATHTHTQNRNRRQKFITHFACERVSKTESSILLPIEIVDVIFA